MNERNQTLVYVTRDIERALGMEPGPSYHIISNRTAYGESIARRYPGAITLIEGNEGIAGTGDLISHPSTGELMARLGREGKHPYVMIFKNTARIEPLVRGHGWTLLNPPAATSEKVENKISQVMWLGSLERFLPPHSIEFMKRVSWIGRPFVLQWAHGHTGGGTILVTGPEMLAELAQKFPERRCRVSEYIHGPSFTLNVVVSPDGIFPSSISYQITGLSPFTDSEFSTIGNDWRLADRLLSDADKKAISDMAVELGNRMQHEYWRGLFGIDVIKDAATGKIYLIELNARQPASTTFESELQLKRRAAHAPEVGDRMTTFEAHTAALMGHVVKPIIPIADGAQIIQRITKSVHSVPNEAVGTLELSGFRAIPYENTGENADLLRIQSETGIMADHGKLDDNGLKIAAAIYSAQSA